MRVHDEHPIAGQDIQYPAPDSRSSYKIHFKGHTELIYLHSIVLQQHFELQK